MKITDLFIQNFNNQSNFLTQANEKNNINNFSNNGNGFSASSNNNDTGGFFNTQNLHPVNLSQNSFGNSGPQGGYQFEENKRVGGENKINNNSTNEVLSNQFKPNNKILSRPFVTNVIPISNNKDLTNNKDFLNKIRRRSIKNNKIVFCHAQKSAARKFVTEVKVL